MAEACPDGGTCHHGCTAPYCWRVENAGPLSGVYPDDEWPTSVRAASVAQRWRERAQASRDDARQAVDRATDLSLSPWNQALYGALYSAPFKVAGMQFRWQGEGFAVFEPGYLTQTVRLLCIVENAALHTIGAYRRGLALFSHSEVDMRVFAEDFVPLEWRSPAFLHCRSREPESPYSVILHLEGHTDEDALLGNLFGPQELASHHNPIAHELARVRHQPILWRDGDFALPSLWAVDSLDAERIEHMARKETREASWLRLEHRTMWVFDNEETFQDWAIGELER